ncbi:MAG: HAD-IA family hydrolase, partial [Blastocatellia bacterium]
MTTKLRAIIFDFNGVIVDDEPLHLELFQVILAEERITLTDAEYHAKYLGFDDRGALTAALADAGRTADAGFIANLIERKAALYRDAIEERYRLFPGVVEMVRRLASKFPMAIASGALRSEIELVLARGGIRDCFQAIVAAEDVAACKPDPEGYVKALAALNSNGARSIQPGECLVIEDSVAGVEAAKRTGMRCLAVTNSYAAGELKQADWVVSSLNDCAPDSLFAERNCMELTPALRCKSLVKKYADVVAVNGLDLEVRAGECFGLLGPNGAGKTTTVEILEGLNTADSGEVELLGSTWGAGADQALRERIGVALQETQLADKLTVEETIRLFRSFYAHGAEVEHVIRLVSLEEKRKARVGKLSGGQKQRLAVACALVGAPEVLFLDEPTTGLDPQARLQLWDVIEKFRAGGGTILLTTHYMEEAARLCDRIAIMDHGRVIALGTPAELIASLGADQIIEFSLTSETFEAAALRRLPGVSGMITKENGYSLTVSQISDALPALLAELERQNVKLHQLTTHQATLEDVFVNLTGRMLRD